MKRLALFAALAFGACTGDTSDARYSIGFANIRELHVGDGGVTCWVVSDQGISCLRDPEPK